jgi:triacylglycerol lipase
MSIINAALFIVALLTPMLPLAQPIPQSQECVVILHGLGRTEWSMKPVQWRLEEAGYTTVNITYPSLTYPIEELAEMAVHDGVSECRALGLQRINFVTHSLGGILVRQYLSVRGIEGLHRVVMLGPPNQGSQAADYFGELAFLSPLGPEAIAQLGTGEESLPRQLGPVNFELGIIAGASSQDTLLPGFPDEMSDGTVALTETVVHGMSDFLQLSVSHTFMMWDSDVLDQVVYFLQSGSFDHRRD